MDRPRYVPFFQRIPPRPRYTTCLVHNAVRSRHSRRLLSTPASEKFCHTNRTPPHRLRQTQTGESARWRQILNAGRRLDNHCGTSRLRVRVFVPISISLELEFAFELLFLCCCSPGRGRRTLMRRGRWRTTELRVTHNRVVKLAGAANCRNKAVGHQ